MSANVIESVMLSNEVLTAWAETVTKACEFAWCAPGERGTEEAYVQPDGRLLLTCRFGGFSSNLLISAEDWYWAVRP
jgi:hypothetical protein